MWSIHCIIVFSQHTKGHDVAAHFGRVAHQNRKITALSERISCGAQKSHSIGFLSLIWKMLIRIVFELFRYEINKI